MKKLCLFLALVCLITLFCGCSAKEYQLVKKSGNYYIKLNKEFDSAATSDNAYIQEMAAVVLFDTMEEMISDIRNGNFTEDELSQIARFETDAAGNIQVCDLDTLFTPQMPGNYSLYKIYWDGQDYCFTLTNGNYPVTFHLRSEASWQEELERSQNWNTGVQRLGVTDTQEHPERNGTVYFYPYATYTADGKSIVYTNRKSCVYSFERNGNTYYVCEGYESDAADAVPHYISILGISQGQHFSVYIGSPEERPSLDWIAQFGLQPYSGSATTE